MSPINRHRANRLALRPQPAAAAASQQRVRDGLAQSGPSQLSHPNTASHCETHQKKAVIRSCVSWHDRLLGRAYLACSVPLATRSNSAAPDKTAGLHTSAGVFRVHTLADLVMFAMHITWKQTAPFGDSYLHADANLGCCCCCCCCLCCLCWWWCIEPPPPPTRTRKAVLWQRRGRDQQHMRQMLSSVANKRPQVPSCQQDSGRWARG